MPNWDYSKIREAGIRAISDFSSVTPSDFELLAWYGNKESDSWRVDVALLGGSFLDAEGKELWVLIQLGRNPKDDFQKEGSLFAELAQWHLYQVHDSGWSPIALFEESPSLVEVENFLEHWHSAQDDSNPSNRGVREAVWVELFGHGPPSRVSEWRTFEHVFSDFG